MCASGAITDQEGMFIYRGHMTLGGAVPEIVHRGDHWQRPALCAERVFGLQPG
ncbi:MAG TPA: hypothetical protein VM221_13810 [Armatimonadota bacterium]|nr:hypothetical protein [Armatimonadota bacterium]